MPKTRASAEQYPHILTRANAHIRRVGMKKQFGQRGRKRHLRKHPPYRMTLSISSSYVLTKS